MTMIRSFYAHRPNILYWTLNIDDFWWLVKFLSRELILCYHSRFRLGRARRRWAWDRWIPHRSASYRRAAARWTPAPGDPWRTASAQHRCGRAEAREAERGDGTKTLGPLGPLECLELQGWASEDKWIRRIFEKLHDDTFLFWDSSVKCGGEGLKDINQKPRHSKIDPLTSSWSVDIQLKN